MADGTELPIFRLDPLLIGSVFPIHGEDRIVLSPADVPPLLRAAIKLVEDRRFDEHHGVDPVGILRALWADLRAGHVVQGGSTLTQQLVKNYFLTDEQTVGRKATEAVMALRLEAHFSKEDILVAYLNEVYLGQDGERAIHGFGLASEYYFAKPLDELDAGALALLIGLVKGPSYYDPRRHPDRARARRNLVLQALADAHLIDSAAAKLAAAEPLGLRPPGGSYVPAYLDLVRRHLKRDYAEADLAAAGLAVYTTLDPRAQAAAERSLMRHLTRLDAASRVRDAHLEGAVIVAEPNSGDVVAVVGGREVGADGFNRALDAHRPIGSLVKPAVYLAALETGRYNAATMLEDAPIELKLGDGSIWAPQNFTHETYGEVPVARALAESMNLATVRMGLDVGLPRVADALQRLGLETRPALNPSLLLGTVEMTPLEVVQVYTSLANGGFRARLRAVRAVLDEHGRPLKSFKVQVESRGTAIRGLPARPDADAGDHARHRPRRIRPPAAGIGRRRQDRHILRHARQLVRGIHGELSRGRLGRLRRQPRHRPHRRRRRTAGLGRYHREPEVRVIPTRAAGTRRGSLDRIRGRARDDAGLQCRRGRRRGAEGHGAAGQARLRPLAIRVAH